MKRKRNHMLLIAGIITVVFFLAACGPAGISVEEAEEIQSEVQDVNSRIADLEDQLAGLEQADEDELAETAEATLGDVISELNTIASRLNDIESQLEPPEEPVDDPTMDDPAMDPAGEGF